MNCISSFVISFVMSALRSRLSLQLKIAALHHQLSVYQRAQRRPAIASSDRLLWSILARLSTSWRGALFFVQPRTVILWRQKCFRDHWRRLSRGDCRGRPAISLELRRLIRRMWQANPTWSSPVQPPCEAARVRLWLTAEVTARKSVVGGGAVVPAAWPDFAS